MKDSEAESELEPIPHALNAAQKARDAGGDIIEAVTAWKNSLPWSVRAAGTLAVGVLLNELSPWIVSFLANIADRVAETAGTILPDSPVVQLTYTFFFLLYIDVLLSVLTFNKLRGIEADIVAMQPSTDGGEPTSRGVDLPRWLWVTNLIVFGVAGHMIFSPFGNLAAGLGVGIGLVVGNELYRRMQDGRFP